MTTYHWEIQRYDPDLGGWRFTDRDLSGAEESDLEPAAFAAEVFGRQGWTAGSDRRCVVWDVPGVGKAPVATFTGCTA